MPAETAEQQSVDVDIARAAAIESLARQRQQAIIDGLGKGATSHVVELVKSGAKPAADGIPAEVRESYAEAESYAEPQKANVVGRKAA